jgi:hypothetical protein
MRLPQPKSFRIEGDIAIYDYGDIDVWIRCRLEQIRRTIVIKSAQGLVQADLYMRTTLEKSNLSDSSLSAKHVGFMKDGIPQLYIKTREARDSAQLPFYPPCMGTEYDAANGWICKPGRDAGCKGCSAIPCQCPGHRELHYRPNRIATETISISNDELVLGIPADWLDSAERVFPVYINDDITPGSGSITLGGKMSGGGSCSAADCVDGDVSTYVGGYCGGGCSQGAFEISFGTDYIEFDLGGTYTVTDVEWRNANIAAWGCCPSMYYKWEYYDGSWHDFVSETDCTCIGESTTQADNPTDQTATKMRVCFRSLGEAPWLRRGFVADVTINGTAAGGGDALPMAMNSYRRFRQ